MRARRGGGFCEGFVKGVPSRGGGAGPRQTPEGGGGKKAENASGSAWNGKIPAPRLQQGGGICGGILRGRARPGQRAGGTGGALGQRARARGAEREPAAAAVRVACGPAPRAVPRARPGALSRGQHATLLSTVAQATSGARGREEGGERRGEEVRGGCTRPRSRPRRPPGAAVRSGACPTYSPFHPHAPRGGLIFLKCPTRPAEV